MAESDKKEAQKRAERHTDLVNRFTQMQGEVDDFGSYMVFLEATILAHLLVLTHVHKLRPDKSAEAFDLAYNKALDRFTQINRDMQRGIRG